MHQLLILSYPNHACHAGALTTAALTTLGDTEGGGGGEDNYTDIVLAVSIPCGVVILTLIIIIAFIVLLMLRTPRFATNYVRSRVYSV